MNIETLASDSLTDIAYETIKRRICTCELAPGTRITEKQLAQELDCGKTPVREALARLALENFVRAIPRSGYEVTTLTLKDFEEIHELSRIIWPPVFVIAATTSDINVINAIQQQMSEQVRDTSNWLERGRMICQIVSQTTSNRRLIALCMHLFDEMERYFTLVIRYHSIKPWFNEIEEQLDNAFLQRDIAELTRLSALYIDLIHQEILLTLQTLPTLLNTPLRIS